MGIDFRSKTENTDLQRTFVEVVNQETWFH